MKGLGPTVLLVIAMICQTELISGQDMLRHIPKLSLIDVWSRLPSVLTATNTSCMQDLQVYLNSFLGAKSVLNLFLYTGKGLNELGDHHGCETHQGKYVIIAIKIPTPIVTLALCIPRECSTDDLSPIRSLLRDMINEQGGIRGQNLTDNEVKAHDVVAENRYNSRVQRGTIVGILLPLLLLILCLAVTVMARLAPSEGKAKDVLRSVLSCFDFVANLKSLFYQQNTLDPNLDIFHGLRILSMFWIVLGHSFAQLGIITPVLNLQDFMDQVNNKYSLFVFTGGTFAVDAFFGFSGFFALIGCTNALRKPGNRSFRSVLTLIVQRYLRLFPIYVASYLIFMYITPCLYDGPIMARLQLTQFGCSDYWYLNFLNLNNFVEAQDMCMSWTWYLANDFQFFLLTPFIVILYYYRKTLAYILVSGLVIAPVSAQAGIITYWKLNPSFFDESYVDYFNKHYTKPYCRITPYFAGMFFGWLYLSYQNRANVQNCANVVNKWIIDYPCLRYAMYLLGLFFMLATVLYFPYFYMGKHGPRSQSEIAAFLILSHPIFAIGLMLLVYPGTLGKARALRVVLGFELFAVLARVTYSVYMVHLVIFYFYMPSLEEGLYFSSYRLFVCAIDVFVLSYVVSIFLTLIFESPIVKLTKYLLRRPPSHSPPGLTKQGVELAVNS